jgi:hypothetical protein
MPSKQVTDRKKSADAVVAAAETHADRVGQAVQATLAPYLQKGEKMPDVALLTALLGRWVGGGAATMVKADESHTHELSDDDPVRERRDRAQEELRAEIVELREWMTGLFGPRAVRSLGFAADTPRDPAALVQFASEVSRSLREKSFPAPKRGNVTWTPSKEAGKVDQLREALESALVDVAREAREAQGTLTTKNAAMSSYDDAFGRAASGIEGLFLVAGESELAARVRPSARRPGQTEELASVPEPQEPDKG